MKTPADFPRLALGFMPTPIEPLKRLSAELGIDLALKRDDFTGFGGGGNKVRKLEFLMAEAVAAGANVLITTGGHQSNHARMVAAAARRFGMEAVLVLRGNPPTAYQGNLLLDRLFGATLEFLEPTEYFTLVEPRMAAHAEAARAAGKVPFIIPLGGATPTGALGYVRAVEEMDAQLKAESLPPPDAIVAPAGSGGTLAGLALGAARHWPQTRIIGISVSRDRAWFQARIAAMANDTAALLEWPERIEPAALEIEDGYVGSAYGVPSPGGNAAVARLAGTEGVLLDPVYTGKAMDGLFGLVASGALPPGARVIFVHCGGSPALYPFADSLLAS
ncbi:1-aminocyclopropane-1-carboxylate deaminase/D-cysteine desulfhydrase [Prosthecodimorpha staleyi]|uniref:D-cysteine desulfhydrase family protein n=1 Tax=Prosthecodimorpha staleyi TaxID=2840188 RepID=A0A947D708_9HYPH|nr:D-cysteine desulfhydrase family protein [Prosthecodimorpha staleyi]MBT9292111.1 D-cysteine desulfhydrase family protein [Prosthecodimorpha staleyi]